MPVRHWADFKQALSTLRQLKQQEDTAHQQRWKSYSSSWWNWQESWWHSSYEHHHEDGPSTDWSGKLIERWLGYLFEVWFSEFIWCIITVQNSLTQFTVTDGRCNTVPPIQQNPMKNGYDENNYNKSDENKCDELQLHKQQVEREHAQQHAAHQARHHWRCWLRQLHGAHHTLSLHIARTVPHLMKSPHTSWLKFWVHSVIHGHTHGAFSLTRISPFFFYWSFLPFSVFFLHPELFLELDNLIVMASLRYSAEDESEDTLNSFTSHTECP